MTKKRNRLLRIEDATREEERMNAPVRSDGVGEDPAVQDLLSDQFPEMSDKEALNVALALQQIIRGQNSILGMVKDQGVAITKLTDRMNKMDEDTRKWNEDRQDFLENVQARSEDLKIKDPEAKARFLAKAGKQVQEELQLALAMKTTNDLQFVAWLEAQPKVTVTSPGKLVTVNDAGVIRSVIEAEVIKIRNKTWILQPGVPTDVPKPVADEFFSRQKIREETIERKKILDASRPMDNVLMAQKWGEINKKYGSQTDIMRAESRE